MRNYLEINGNKNTSYQNLWDAAKAVLTRKLTGVNTFLKIDFNQQPNFTTEITRKRNTN